MGQQAPAKKWLFEQVMLKVQHASENLDMVNQQWRFLFIVAHHPAVSFRGCQVSSSSSTTLVAMFYYSYAPILGQRHCGENQNGPLAQPQPIHGVLPQQYCFKRNAHSNASYRTTLVWTTKQKLPRHTRGMDSAPVVYAGRLDSMQCAHFYASPLFTHSRGCQGRTGYRHPGKVVAMSAFIPGDGSATGWPKTITCPCADRRFVQLSWPGTVHVSQTIYTCQPSNTNNQETDIRKG